MRAARIWGPAIAAVGIAAVLLAVASSHKRPTTPAPADADEWRYETRTWKMPLDAYDVRIEDVGMTSALEPVLERTGAELVINGGFFDKADKALGLAVSGGKQLAPLAKSLSGGVVTIAGDRAVLHETESFALPEATTFAVQCRPRLVVGGAPNVRSDDGKRSERTALCLKDGGRTIEIVTARGQGDEPGGPSLHRFARWLVAEGCEDALNLDGGPSTGAAWREGSRVVTSPPRGPLRHAIAFVKKNGSTPPSHSRVDGHAFPDHVLSLTWDDGPDAHTIELARFLKEQKVSATFFVVGGWAQGLSSDPGEGDRVFETGHSRMPVLGDLVALGHRLGNHTSHHVLLGTADAATVVRELETNQRAIDPFLGSEVRFFRAPGGSWSDAAARAVDDDPYLRTLIGPFHWDIDRKDWEGSLYCRDEAAADCEPAAPGGAKRVKPSVIAERYVRTIESAGHGIVLFHDRVGHVGSRYAMDVARAVVPALVAKGYVFAPPVLRFGPLELRTSEAFGDDLAIVDGALCDERGCARRTTRTAKGETMPRVAFGAKEPSTKPREPRRHTGDLNGDGRPDACREEAGGIACSLSTGQAMTTPTIWLTGPVDPTWTLGDINGDGRADLCIRTKDGVSCALSP